MNVEFFVISLLNGVSYGLLLFMLSSGLTLIFSMMGVLNFAHTSFYMLGAYVAYTLSGIIGFWPALFIAPLLVGALGAAFERYSLRRVHKFGHVPELLVTFGLSYLILEVVQLVWGRSTVPYGAADAAAGPAVHAVRHPVSQVALLHHAGRAADAGVGVAAADAHAHRTGDPGGAQASRDGRGARATTCRASSCWCSAAAPRWPAWPA